MAPRSIHSWSSQRTRLNSRASPGAGTAHPATDACSVPVAVRGSGLRWEQRSSCRWVFLRERRESRLSTKAGLCVGGRGLHLFQSHSTSTIGKTHTFACASHHTDEYAVIFETKRDTSGHAQVYPFASCVWGRRSAQANSDVDFDGIHLLCRSGVVAKQRARHRAGNAGFRAERRGAGAGSGAAFRCATQRRARCAAGCSNSHRLPTRSARHTIRRTRNSCWLNSGSGAGMRTWRSSMCCIQHPGRSWSRWSHRPRFKATLREPPVKGDRTSGLARRAAPVQRVRSGRRCDRASHIRQLRHAG